MGGEQIGLAAGANISKSATKKSIRENDFFDNAHIHTKARRGVGEITNILFKWHTGVAGGGGVSLKESLCMGWGGPPPQVGTNSCVCVRGV